MASFFYASPRRDSCRLGVLSCVDCQVGKVVRGNRLRGVADVGEMLDLLREGEWEVFRRGEQSDYSEAFRELVTHHAATTMASFFNGKVCRSAKCAGCRSDAVAKVEAMNSVDVAIGPDVTCVAQAVKAFFQDKVDTRCETCNATAATDGGLKPPNSIFTRGRALFPRQAGTRRYLAKRAPAVNC